MSLDKELVLAELRAIKSYVEGVITNVEQGFLDQAEPTQPPATSEEAEQPPMPVEPKEGNGLENPYRGGELGSASGNPYTDDPNVDPQDTLAPGDLKITTDRMSSLAHGQAVVAAALTQQGKPYGWGATGPDAWDCSALAQFAYRVATGTEIGRTTYDQIKGGREIPFEEAQAGDLIFSNFSSPTTPEHVSINMDGPDDVLEAGDPVGIYKWGNRGAVIVKRYL